MRDKEYKILYSALRKLATHLDITIVPFPGEHGFYAKAENRIYLGQYQDGIKRCVVLAHEIAHALDYKDNPPSAAEQRLIDLGPVSYLPSQENLIREKNTWKIAESILKGAGFWRVVESVFNEYSLESVSEYEKLSYGSTKGNPRGPRRL